MSFPTLSVFSIAHAPLWSTSDPEDVNKDHVDTRCLNFFYGTIIFNNAWAFIHSAKISWVPALYGSCRQSKWWGVEEAIELQDTRLCGFCPHKGSSLNWGQKPPQWFTFRCLRGPENGGCSGEADFLADDTVSFLELRRTRKIAL